MAKEYIEREAAIKELVDDYAYAAAGLIEKIPTADVQEVVRCKDCNNFNPNLSCCNDNCIGAFGRCQITHMNVSLDFYCGYGQEGDTQI